MGHEAVRNCAVHLIDNYGGRMRLPKKAKSRFKMGYDPELDTSPELDQHAASCYLTIFGILRWMIKLGRIDFSSHIALPSKGHLDAAVYVMALQFQIDV